MDRRRRLITRYRTRAHPFVRWGVRALIFIAAVFASITALASAALWIQSQANDQFRWRNGEYTKLTGLRAGFDVAMFDQSLGAPAFKTQKKGHSERIYRGREYWVQTVAKASGEVLMYSVTSCSDQFRPKFPIGSEYALALRETPVGEVVTRDGQFSDIDYFIPGATASLSIVEFFYGGNPGEYKSWAWGINDACGDFYDSYDTLFELPDVWEQFGGDYEGQLSEAPKVISEIRSEFPANLYAEVGPMVEFEQITDLGFQIGADRIRTRTAD